MPPSVNFVKMGFIGTLLIKPSPLLMDWLTDG